ncbi:MAG TPA: hypothetical protein DEP05_02635 [Betaproteobacteria bacterium]|nr:hypothetical protein [Betaproteobacteria bacterium]
MVGPRGKQENFSQAIDAAKTANRDRVRAWRSRNTDKQQVALYLSRPTYQLLRDAAHREAINLSAIAERTLSAGLLKQNQTRLRQSSAMPKGGEQIIGTIWSRKKQAAPWEVALTEIVSAVEEFVGCLEFNQEAEPLSQGIMQDVPIEVWEAIQLIYGWSRG